VTIALVLFVALALGVPLFVVIGCVAALAFSLYGGVEGFEGMQILVVKMVGLTSKNVFLAIPFFVVSGALMSAGSIAARLVEVADALVGWMRGGLAVASVVASVVFAAISGSSPVTLIAIGGIMFPAMLKAGYREKFSLGLLTTAGSLGCLVPPSIPMLVYAISVTGTAAVDVRELFMAGLGPAVLIAALLSIYAVLRAGPVAQHKRFSLGTLGQAMRRGVWALFLPVLVLGGIYGGVFTATEASAMSVVYAVVVEVGIHRSLQISALPGVLVGAISSMGGLLLVILLSFAINDFLVDREVGQLALEIVQRWGLGPVGFMIAINLFLIVTGMFMDSISAIVLFTPIIAPAAVALGIDPLHLGVVFIVNMEIGYLAPPIATNLFVASTIFKRPFGLVTRAVMPTLGILCGGLLLVTYVPTLSIGPVHALRGGSIYQPFAAGAGAQKPPLVAPVAPPAPSPTGSRPDAGPGRVLTLAELQRLAEARRADAGAARPDGGVADAPRARVLTLEELQRIAEARRADAGVDAAR